MYQVQQELTSTISEPYKTKARGKSNPLQTVFFQLTEEEIQTSKMKGGYYISKKHIVVISILFVLIIVGVGLMAGLIRTPCPEVRPDDTTTTGAPSPAPTTPQTGPEPWYQPFLPSYTVPVHYDLYLYPDFYFNGNLFNGKIHIEINVTADSEYSNYILVHYKEMTITKTTLKYKNGADIEITRTFPYDVNQFWVTEAKEKITKGKVIILYLEFQGSLTNGIVGFYKSTYTNTQTGEESWLATSKFQPTHARKAFPNFDEPEYKSTFTLTMKHWNNFTALSNMPVENFTEVDTNFRETTFQKSVPMVSYLVCFIVCDFTYRSNTLANGKQHRVWATKDKIEQVTYALQVGKTVADYFEEEFNMTYHLPKLDQVAIPDYSSGATEHWGLVTYRETNLLYDENQVSAAGKQRVAVVVAHELAHNYFGNLLTCRWWNDIWLNEGFANFYQHKGVRAQHPDWEMIDHFVITTQQSIMRSDAQASSRPVVVPVTHPDQINEAFDGITYNKGASMLRMLEDFIGVDRFRNAMRKYLVKHEFQTVATNDLWASLQEEVGTEMNITELMDPWVHQMGLPVVNVTVSAGNPGSVVAKQGRFLTNPDSDPTQPPSPYRYKWFIPLTYNSSNAAEGRVWMNQTDVTFPSPITSASEWVKFNRRQAGFFRVNYDQSMWADLSKQLMEDHQAFEAVDRSNLLDDAFNLARATQLDYPTALQLTTYMKNETHYFPWKTVKNALDYIGLMLYGRKDYNLWRTYMLRIASPAMKFLQVEDKGSHLQRLLRTDVIRLACGHGDMDCLKNVTDMFKLWLLNDTQNAVSPSLRPAVYQFGMRQTGGEVEWSTMWERYTKATSGQEKSYLLYGLAQTDRPWLLQRFLEYAMDTSKIRSQDFFTLISYVRSTPIGNRIAWDWTRTNYDKLIERFGLNDRYFGRMLPGIVDEYKTEFELKEVEEFYKKYPDAGAGARSREQALESIRSNIAWLQRNEQPIVEWLQQNVL